LEEEYKQAIVLRGDIKMSKGKAAAQAAHAAVEAVLIILDSDNPIWHKWLREWRREGQKKVVLKARDEKELLELFESAKRLGLPVSIIRDAGRTELPPGTLTAIAIGPAPAPLVDRVTGKLKLF